MKQTKRVLAVFLIVAMVLALVPVASASSGYTDVRETSWYAEPVAFVTGMGLMRGVGNNAFAPESTTTRAMVITTLYRLQGSTDVWENSFPDVEDHTWYTQAVGWGTSNGIVRGYPDGTFKPHQPVTREELVTLLYRFAAYVGKDSQAQADLGAFTDRASVARFAQKAMSWAVAERIIMGRTSTTLAPKGITTRAELATMLMRFYLLIWTGPEGSATVTFLLNDGTPGAYEMQVVPVGSAVEQPVDPAMELYRFTGWYTEPETVNQFDFTMPIIGDTFLYAGWGDPEKDEESLYAGNAGGGTCYSITGLEMLEDQVSATINTNNSAILVVRFYADTQEMIQGSFVAAADQMELLAEFSVRTPDYCEMVPVTLPVTETLPQYYYITADLYNDLGEKLCDTFVSMEETARYEVFEAKTVSDFQEDRVVQFSQETDNNFGVLASDVKQITCTDTTNVLTVTTQAVVTSVMAEDSIEPVDDRIYTFENPDQELLALQPGDSVYLTGTSYLFKIGTVDRRNGQVTMTESGDVDIRDFYDFLKVDMDIVNEPEADPNTVSTCSWDVLDGESSFQIGGGEDTIKWKPKDWLSVGGGISGTGSIKVKITYDLKLFAKDYLYISFNTKLSFKVAFKVEASIDNDEKVDTSKKDKTEVVLAKLHVATPVPGLTIEVKPSIPLELSAAGNFNIEYTTSMESGFTYSSYDGREDKDKKESSLKIYAQGEASVKAGPKLKISLAFCKEVFTAGIGAEAGVSATIKTNEIGANITNEESKHGCTLCLQGELKWYAKVSADVKYKIIKDVLEGTVGKWDIVSFEGNFPISPNCYFSLINSRDSYLQGKVTFGWGECPNTCYRTTIQVVDENGNNLNGLEVMVTQNSTGIRRSGKSPYRVYLYDGTFTAATTIQGVSVSKALVVSGDAQVITLSASSADGKVYGQVQDADTGNAIAGAEVIITQKKTPVTTVTTGLDGSYQVTLADGTYQIRTTKEGYCPFEEYVTVSNNNTTYLQVIPASSDSCPSKAFTDLDTNRWYHRGVDFVLETGLMQGMSGTLFQPDGQLTRGQTVTILYRLAGSPEATGSVPFTDVADGRYYTAAVAWAYETGIVKGVTKTLFVPEAPVTREQLVTFLARYAAGTGVDITAQGTLEAYPDAASVSPYARPYMAWAVENGIIVSLEGRLAPKGTATRAQAATILYRYCEAFDQ